MITVVSVIIQVVIVIGLIWFLELEYRNTYVRLLLIKWGL